MSFVYLHTEAIHCVGFQVAYDGLDISGVLEAKMLWPAIIGHGVSKPNTIIHKDVNV